MFGTTVIKMVNKIRRKGIKGVKVTLQNEKGEVIGTTER